MKLYLVVRETGSRDAKREQVKGVFETEVEAEAACGPGVHRIDTIEVGRIYHQPPLDSRIVRKVTASEVGG